MSKTVKKLAVIDGFFNNPLYYAGYSRGSWIAVHTGPTANGSKPRFLKGRQTFDVSQVKVGDVLQVAGDFGEVARYSHENANRAYWRVIRCTSSVLEVLTFATLAKALHHARHNVKIGTNATIDDLLDKAQGRFNVLARESEIRDYKSGVADNAEMTAFAALRFYAQRCDRNDWRPNKVPAALRSLGQWLLVTLDAADHFIRSFAWAVARRVVRSIGDHEDRHDVFGLSLFWKKVRKLVEAAEDKQAAELRLDDADLADAAIEAVSVKMQGGDRDYEGRVFTKDRINRVDSDFRDENEAIEKLRMLMKQTAGVDQFVKDLAIDFPRRTVLDHEDGSVKPEFENAVGGFLGSEAQPVVMRDRVRLYCKESWQTALVNLAGTLGGFRPAGMVQ